MLSLALLLTGSLGAYRSLPHISNAPVSKVLRTCHARSRAADSDSDTSNLNDYGANLDVAPPAPIFHVAIPLPSALFSRRTPARAPFQQMLCLLSEFQLRPPPASSVVFTVA